MPTCIWISHEMTRTSLLIRTSKPLLRSFLVVHWFHDFVHFAVKLSSPMSGPAHESLSSLLQEALVEGATLTPALEVAGALARNTCGEIAHVAKGTYQRAGASSKTPAANPPNIRWGYASVTKTLVGVVMQMIIANQSLPQISWKLCQFKQNVFE